MNRRLRAAMIAAVLFSQALAAIPNVPRLQDDALSDSNALTEIDAWRNAFALVGVKRSREEVFALGIRLTEGLREARKTAVAPVRPFLKATGTGQGWGLFSFPDQRPSRLEIAVDRGAGWETIYADLDTQRAYRAELFAYRRVRAVYNPGRKPPPAYRPFSAWLADRVFEDVAGATAVRIGFRKRHRVVAGQRDAGFVRGLEHVRRFDRKGP